MKAGIKVGLRDWHQVLAQVNPDCLEIWFRLDWQKKYTSMFKELRRKKIPFGLHFWAMVDGKYLPNLMSLTKNIAEKTYLLILKTIEIAQKHKASYINFHPESYRQPILDLDSSTFRLDKEEGVNREKSFKQLLRYLAKIKRYALKKKVIPYIETIPKYVPSNFKNIVKGRLKPYKSEGLETDKFFKLAKKKQPICFDLGHTMGQCITDNNNELFDYLYSTAKRLLTAVGLIHVTTNQSPFNGTDSHNGILEEDFKQGVVPTRDQLIKLLKLFKNKDVWLIPEPHGKMIENFLELKKIVKEIVN